tara:strand:+ start:3004 stop:4701 length:1698 start_codon:yes stop_codon:yes gene_type:complete
MNDIFNILDYTIIGVYIIFMLTVGILMKKYADRGTKNYFIGGKEVPWWAAGISMVATTFAADTPLAVTGIVAINGIAGNWIWWNFMFSGIFTVFLYAKLWHRAGVTTDAEFITLRYSGKPARFLRGFRALYLALPINCIILGWVTLGMTKLLSVITGVNPWVIIIMLYILTTIYITISGIWGIIATDFFQFIIAMVGSIILMFFAIDHVGGINQLVISLQEQFGKGHHMLNMSPFNHPKILISTVLVWLGMQWWASWYPGAEPGGGGYIAQRIFSTKTDKDAVKASLLFNIAHYAIRPWPWIIVALVSIVSYPDLSDPEKGYPKLMMDLLPNGLLGLLVISFLSAFMSTVSTHLNWGASYIVNDFYKLYFNPNASEKHYLNVAKIATIIMMFVAIWVSLIFDSVKSGWEFILSLGAGTGMVYLLRWYWWRINAWSEVSAMIAAIIGSVLAPQFGFYEFADKMVFTTLFTTIIWLSITLLTNPEPKEKLENFYNKIKPLGLGWNQFDKHSNESIVQGPFINIILAIIVVQGFLFGIGNFIIGSLSLGFTLVIIGSLSAFLLIKRIN